MIKKSVVLTLCLILTYLIGSISIFGQENELDVSNKRVSLRMDKVPFGFVLGYLMVTYDIPIGFEQSTMDRSNSESQFSSNPPGLARYPVEKVDGVFKMSSKSNIKLPEHPITIYSDNEKLENVLNSIVQQVGNYQWEVNDGVINIYPAKGRDERFEQLLHLKIKRFVVERNKSVWEITKNIRTLPEFSEFLATHKLRFNGTRSGPEDALEEQYGRQIGERIDFSNLTFRDLLNKVTKIKRGGWILRWRFYSTKRGDEFIDIDI